MASQTRRQWHGKFGAPNTAFTACPSMDKLVKGRLSTVTRSRDRQLARHQASLLDAVGPVTHILEQEAKVWLTPTTAIEAAQMTLKLFGNASCQANRERWKNAILNMNPRLADMAETPESISVQVWYSVQKHTKARHLYKGLLYPERSKHYGVLVFQSRLRQNVFPKESGTVPAPTIFKLHNNFQCKFKVQYDDFSL